VKKNNGPFHKSHEKSKDIEIPNAVFVLFGELVNPNEVKDDDTCSDCS
jgi:hypothetical protein